jgi:DNA-directed RNA polymerase specialized sigma24 family protein
MAASCDEIEQLYARRYRSFRHAAAVIVGDYERAHDVLQEAFARALGARRGFRGGSLDAWDWRIVEREAFDARRVPAGQPLDETIDLELRSRSATLSWSRLCGGCRRAARWLCSCATSPICRTET